MDIQLITPSPTITTTIAPSTPKHFPNFYYSAPTTPIHTTFQPDNDDEFAFDFSGPLDPLLISDADELFHCGQIKTTSFSRELKSDYFIETFHQTPDGQTQPTQKKPDYFTKAFYQTRGGKTQLTRNPPKQGRETTIEKDSDYFIEAFYRTPDSQTHPTQNPPKRRTETTTEKDSEYLIETFYQTPSGKTQLTQNPTTREKDTDCFIEAFHRTPGGQTQTPPKRTRDKASRCSSPFRVSDILAGEDNNQKAWYNKWNLKNLLLFRSTSEGSGRRRKEVVNKYSRIRSADGCRRGVSAHEMHYMANRAVAEEMRRKTYLPYKSGVLGCLG